MSAAGTVCLEHIDAALQEAERVCKKQKVCAGKITECIDALIQEISAAQQQLTMESDVAGVMQQLSQRCSKPEALKELSDSTKDLHSAVNKLGKVSWAAQLMGYKEPLEVGPPDNLARQLPVAHLCTILHQFRV